MANHTITKDTFAGALKELLKTRPLAKITVKDITGSCGLSRNSFYYHFRDKYELVNWVLYSDLARVVPSFRDASKLTENYVKICECLCANREFYLACFQYMGQNSLFESLQNLYHELWSENLEQHYAGTKGRMTAEEIDLMAELNAHALVGMIAGWVKSGMKDSYLGNMERVKALLDRFYYPVPGKW